MVTKGSYDSTMRFFVIDVLYRDTTIAIDSSVFSGLPSKIVGTFYNSPLLHIHAHEELGIRVGLLDSGNE